MNQHVLPHETLLIIIATQIGNMVHLKYLINPVEERKSQHLEKSKEEALHGSSSATTSTMNSKLRPRSTVMSVFNGTSILSILVRSRNMTK